VAGRVTHTGTAARAATMPAAPRVEVRSRAAWRAWLARHHRHPGSVWVVTWKKGRGPHVPYADVRDEALCFGWIDSRPARLDAERTMLLLSPRRPGSGWSRVNKARVDALEADGRMTDAGRAAIAAARADGSWHALDAAHALVVPTDLRAALDAHPPAAARFAAFAPSARRGILEWIGSAKRPDTRARRVAATARLAAQGLRANHPETRRGPAAPDER
jgi:uncharacterized protein YdeI (YjbR/CyaY-like superfamily)